MKAHKDIILLKIRWLIYLMLYIVSMLYAATTAFAAHPLITDDTGTQGKGKFQLEVNGQYDYDKEDGVKTKGTQMAATISYGAIDTLDIVLGVPYQHISIKDSETTSKEDGIADISIEAKWRFYEKDGLSFALKPGISLPTGDEEKGLGSGKMTYRLFFITTKEIEPWAFHLNLGYIRNENDLDERKDIWHVSLASTVEVVKNLQLVGNIGAEKNADEGNNTNPAFIIAGIIYSLSENFDVDFGIKGGLNKPETDYSVLAGITWRF